MDRFGEGLGGGNGRNGGNGRGLPVPPSSVREALVARLKSEVQEGTYRVDARAVATRMLPVLFPHGLSA